MALVGTISGSNGTSNTAISGTLVVANTSTSFPQIPGDTTLFVQGIVSGTSDLSIVGNITGSNALLRGDLALNGGDLTTTSTATATLFNTNATTVNIAGGATSGTTVGNGTGGVTLQGSATVAGSLQVNGNAIKASGGATALTLTTGNLTGSNMQLTGDLALDGGDLTSTAGTLNIATGLATQLNVGGITPIIEIGTFGGSSSTRLAYGQTASPAVKTVEIGTRGNSGSTTNVTIGSTTAGALGRITLSHDVALTTGNIIGAPGSGANVMTIISSGNLIAKMDANNDGGGHKFSIQDYRNIDQFTVFEEGNAEISGSLVVSGSSLQTITTTTYNLLTTALTGTLNVGTLARSIIIGGTAATSSFTGAVQVDGRSTLSSITEKLIPSVGGTGTVAYDLSVASIFYANGPTGDITANFTNVPTTNNRIITPTVILSQSATARIVSAVQIDTTAQTINWANGTTPTGTANKQDVFGFSLIRSGSTWKVLGQMSTYG